MDDKEIIDLYWRRSEHAISETAKKYGNYCYAIAFNILHNKEDAEECINDAYLKIWNAIPPFRPERFSAYIGKITRNLALHKYEYYKAKKRGCDENTILFDELQECIPTSEETEQIVDDILLAEVLNRFLATLSKDSRVIFMRRYWYFNSIKEIAMDLNISESKAKMSLLRSRKKLKKMLEKENLFFYT